MELASILGWCATLDLSGSICTIGCMSPYMHFKRALEGKHSQNKKSKNKIHKVTTRTPRKVKDLCILGHLHPHTGEVEV